MNEELKFAFGQVSEGEQHARQLPLAWKCIRYRPRYTRDLPPSRTG